MSLIPQCMIYNFHLLPNLLRMRMNKQTTATHDNMNNSYKTNVERKKSDTKYLLRDSIYVKVKNRHN